MTSTSATLLAPAAVTTGRGGWLQRAMPQVEHRVTALAWTLVAGLLVLVVSELAGIDVMWPYDDPAPSPWVNAVDRAAPGLRGALVPAIVTGHVLAVGALLLVRRHPRLATTAAAVPFLTIPLFGTFAFGWWWALAGVALVAALTRVRDAVPAFVLAIGVIAVWNAKSWMYALFAVGAGSASGGTAGWWTVLGYTAYLGAAVTIAAALGARLRYSADSAAAIAAQRDATLAASVTADRAGLARDLHDVVAHHISLIAVRAESAPYVNPDLDEGARTVLREIATDARSALTELRQVLTVLQRSEEAATAPQPDADDVVPLVDEARSAGQVVELHGVWSRVPVAQGYVLYRAVQEGLTNARRHAAGSPVTLVLQQRGDMVGFRLTNESSEEDAVPGRGLAGMRERVESLGGALETDHDGGSFTLVVTLPAGEGR